MEELGPVDTTQGVIFLVWSGSVETQIFSLFLYVSCSGHPFFLIPVFEGSPLGNFLPTFTASGSRVLSSRTRSYGRVVSVLVPQKYCLLRESQSST